MGGAASQQLDFPVRPIRVAATAVSTARFACINQPPRRHHPNAQRFRDDPVLLKPQERGGVADPVGMQR